MWNGFAFWFTPLVVIVAVALLVRQRKSLKMVWFFFAGLPLGPSHGVKHLFPGVHTPPDAAHSDPVPTFVDDRDDPDLPIGLRKQPD